MLILLPCIFIAIIVFKILTNLVKLIKCKKYLYDFTDWQKNFNKEFVNKRINIIKLFKNAGLNNVKRKVIRLTKNRTTSEHCVEFYDLFPTRDKIIIQTADRYFHDAIEIFKGNIIDAVNPLYWIETIVFLPKIILNSLGLDMEKVTVKLLNILATFIWWILSFSFIFYQEYISDFLNYIKDKFS